MITYRTNLILLFTLLLMTVPVWGQISFEPILLYDDPDTQYELTDAILTPDGNLMIAWYFYTSGRMGSKVHTFSPLGEPQGSPFAVLDVPIGQITCKPVSHITMRESSAWAALTGFA